MKTTCFRLTLIAFLLAFISSGLRSNLVRAESIPERAQIKGLVGKAQSYNLSCESRSAVDWAGYWGVSIREKKFLGNLPRSDNPDRGFVGRPNGVWGNVPPASYGVHAEPVAALLREFGLDAQARRGMSWDDLRADIAAGRPVIAWIIGLVWPGSPQKYRASDGSVSVVARYEHTVIVIGYTSAEVTLVDASTGFTHKFAKQAFMRSWSTLGYMAVTGSGPVKQQPSPTSAPAIPEVKPLLPRDLPVHLFLPAVHGGSMRKEPASAAGETPDTYTVRRGDFLTMVARKFGLNWRELARLNGLNPPYVIFTGQVLRLK